MLKVTQEEFERLVRSVVRKDLRLRNHIYYLEERLANIGSQITPGMSENNPIKLSWRILLNSIDQLEIKAEVNWSRVNNYNIVD